MTKKRMDTLLKELRQLLEDIQTFSATVEKIEPDLKKGNTLLN